MRGSKSGRMGGHWWMWWWVDGTKRGKDKRERKGTASDFQVVAVNRWEGRENALKDKKKGGKTRPPHRDTAFAFVYQAPPSSYAKPKGERVAEHRHFFYPSSSSPLGILSGSLMCCGQLLFPGRFLFSLLLFFSWPSEIAPFRPRSTGVLILPILITQPRTFSCHIIALHKELVGPHSIRPAQLSAHNRFSWSIRVFGFFSSSFFSSLWSSEWFLSDFWVMCVEVSLFYSCSQKNGLLWRPWKPLEWSGGLGFWGKNCPEWSRNVFFRYFSDVFWVFLRGCRGFEFLFSPVWNHGQGMVKAWSSCGLKWCPHGPKWPLNGPLWCFYGHLWCFWGVCTYFRDGPMIFEKVHFFHQKWSPLDIILTPM